MWKYKYTGQAEHLFNKMSAEIILKHCKDFDNTLELGCGTAQLSKLLLHANSYVSLVDSSSTACQYVLDYFHAMNISDGWFVFYKTSIFSFANKVLNNYEAEPNYDMVLSSGLIEHFKDDGLKQICNIHKQLSNKYIVIIVPADNPENNAQAKTEKHIKKYGYEKPMNEKQLDFLFLNNNIKLVHTERFYKNGKLLISIYQKECI